VAGAGTPTAGGPDDHDGDDDDDDDDDDGSREKQKPFLVGEFPSSLSRACLGK
jgi:hypothetical protein